MHPAKELCCSKSEKLKGKRIVLGVTGSIAAVETVKLARELIRHGAEVFPAMSQAAQKIIHPYALEFATGNAPVTEIDGKVQHVAFCGDVEDKVDLLLIAPSTANTISKIAYGIDDTIVTTFATTAIGSKIPIMIIPAMHISMYNHPIVIENIERLKKIGIRFVEPKIEEHKAKMPEIQEIIYIVVRIIGKADLKEKKLLVIGGSTEEPMDDVRFMTNKSSGRTGVELALNAYERGADTEIWMGHCQVRLPGFIPVRRFKSVSNLLDMTDDINHDIVLVPAAISDYSVEKQEGKIPSGKKDLTLKLKPNPKVIRKVREKSNCFLVGFKAEFDVGKEKLIEKAKIRMNEAGLDMMIANDLAQATQDENHVFIIDKNGTVDEFSGKKGKIAERILDKVVSLC